MRPTTNSRDLIMPDLNQAISSQSHVMPIPLLSVFQTIRDLFYELNGIWPVVRKTVRIKKFILCFRTSKITAKIKENIANCLVETSFTLHAVVFSFVVHNK